MDYKSTYQHLLPISLAVEQGKDYLWCGCGKSKSPPLCDGGGRCEQTVLYHAALTEDVNFCNCKQTKNPPWCDGSHAKLLLDAIKNRK